jgi:SAM-dependent methyltransferase
MMDSNFVLDEKGIWTSSKKQDIMYSETGNRNSREAEEQNSFWFEHRNNIISRVIRNFPFAHDFADIGGGNGFQLLPLKKEYPNRKFYLIEPGYFGCETARTRGIEYVYNCIFQEFDFSKTQIDGLGLFDVLEHIPDDKRFLNELYNIISPGSILYVTLPTYEFLWNDVDDYGKHQRRYTKKMVYQTVGQTGFEILYFTYFFSYVVIPTFLLRTIPYKIFGNRTEEEILKAEAQQHKPGKLLDAAFTMFNEWEVGKVNAHKSVPFGGSCFVVLRKNK